MNAVGTVFISYARDDAVWTRKLAADLERDGFTVFFDEWDIVPGDMLVQRLDEGLKSASSGLIVFSNATHGRPWPATEYAALVQRMQRGEARVIPVLLDDVNLPPILGTHVTADFRYCSSETEYRSRLLTLERALRGQRPERTGGGGPAFPPDFDQRPEGPRQVTLTIAHDHVTIENGQRNAMLQHNGPGQRVQERLWHLERTRRRMATSSVSHSRPAPSPAAQRSEMQELLVALGQALGNQFLAGPVAELLEEDLASADRQNAAVRIALQISQERQLRALPWQTLCLPGHDTPLVLHPRTQLHYLIPGLGSAAGISIPGPLRLLSVIASPEHGTGELLDYEAELDRILRAVDRARREERARVRVLEWGSAAAIRRALLEDRYHILHISCQARPGALMLETADGEPDAIDARRFSDEVLVPDRGVPLIVLAGSVHATGADMEPPGTVLPDLAKGLLAHGVPAVLVAASDISDRYAIQLASHFYQSLASRQTAPEPLAALSDARRELERARAKLPAEDPESALVEWWMPALYLRTAPAPLFNPDTTAIEAAATAAGGRPLAGPSGPAGRSADDFVGRRSELRKLLRVLRGHEPAAIVYGIGGMGKTSLATRLIAALGEEADIVLFVRGRTTPTEILQQLGARLRPLCLKWHLGQAHELSQAAYELRDPRQGWDDQLTLAEDVVLPHASVLLVLDEAEQNMADAGQDTRDEAPTTLTDPELARFIARWTGLGQKARLLITSRYPITLDDEVASRVTSHHLGPLSRAETGKLMWRLTALDALEPAERDRAYADVGGHPRALEYLDSLLRGNRARFADVASRMEAALRVRNIDDPTTWLASGPRDLNQALAQTVTLIVDDVLVDRLVVRLQSYLLALQLFVAASVFRTPVSATGLNWSVAESLRPAPDPERQARIGRAYQQLASALRQGSAFTLEQLGLPASLLAELKRDCAVHGRPAERAGLARAIQFLVEMSLLSQVQDPPSDDPQYLVHRWTARGLRDLVTAGLASLVDAAELTKAHRRAAAYYEWRADLWPDAVADLLEARYHHQETGDSERAATITGRAAAILFRWGAFNYLSRLCEETLPDLAQAGIEACELRHWQSRAAQAQGDLGSAERLCQEALALAQRLNDTRWIAICRERLASISVDRSEYEPAWTAYRTALDLARDLHDAVIEARCYQGFGAVALARGDDDEAERYSKGALNSSLGRLWLQERIIAGLRQLAELARVHGDTENAERLAREISERQGDYRDLKQVAGQSQLQIGKLALRRDDIEGAEVAFEKAKVIAEESRDRVMRKDCYLQLGRIWQRRGAFRRARESYQRYINLADDMGDRPGTVDCYHQLGELAMADKDYARAAELYASALKLAEQLGQSRLLAEAHRRLAQTHLAVGNVDAARASYRRSEEIGERSGDPQITVSSRLGLAEVELRSGQPGAAEEIYRACRTIARNEHDQVGVIRCQMGLATIARRRSDYDDATYLFEEAYNNAEAMGNRVVALECLRELGETAASGRERAVAAGYYRDALNLAEELKDGMEIADLCRRLGNLAGDFGQRMGWYRQAAEMLEALGYQLAAAEMWVQISNIAASYDLDEAVRCCRLALELAGPDEQSPVTVEAYLGLARFAREQGEHTGARAACAEASQLAEGLRRDDLIARACQEDGLASQLTGERVRARELHRRALDLAGRADDRDTGIASCRDLGRLARWEPSSDQESLEYWYRRALSLAEQAGDDRAAASCAQQLLLAAYRSGEPAQAALLRAQRPVLVAHLDADQPADSRLARQRGRLGADLTREGRPDEALGFTAASLLAWLDIDRQQVEEQRAWLRRQRAELGEERFARLLAEFAEDRLLDALLDISMPGGAGSGEVGVGQADGGEGPEQGQ